MTRARLWLTIDLEHTDAVADHALAVGPQKTQLVQLRRMYLRALGKSLGRRRAALQHISVRALSLIIAASHCCEFTQLAEIMTGC